MAQPPRTYPTFSDTWSCSLLYHAPPQPASSVLPGQPHPPMCFFCYLPPVSSPSSMAHCRSMLASASCLPPSPPPPPPPPPPQPPLPVASVLAVVRAALRGAHIWPSIVTPASLAALPPGGRLHPSAAADLAASPSRPTADQQSGRRGGVRGTSLLFTPDILVVEGICQSQA